MSDIAIKVNNLSKLYQLGTARSTSLRETLVNKWNLLAGRKESGREDFWALKDVSFEIKRGEAVGIIGKNGAGKSTLLKVLSRITEPTRGRIEIEGRIASLLEVGTGFHPELTGRENVYLNGSILGMTRREIKSKFDEIVEFSGVAKFIDTPVKFYSSGMYVRLAFAVAAHLEPEILIIDEVLAVGDAEFQKKCLGKMGEVTGQGRTVLFVSHQMAAVSALCQKGILLKGGKVVQHGPIRDTIDYYQQNMATSTHEFDMPLPVLKNSLGYAEKVFIEDEFGSPCSVLPTGKAFQIRVRFTVAERVPHFIVGIGFTTMDDLPIRTVWSKPSQLSAGTYEAVFREENVFFASGKYKINVGLSVREQAIYYNDSRVHCEFADYIDKEVAVAAGVGFIISPMAVQITKLNLEPI